MIYRKQTSFAVGLLSLLLCALLLTQPAAAAAGFTAGLRLCCTSLLPALFPFFVLCNLLIASGAYLLPGKLLRPLTRLWGIRSNAAPGLLLLSWLGGYAVCAVCIRRSYALRAVTGKESAQLLLLGCCSSPGFVIGCIGGQWFSSVTLGVLLYFLQLSANLFSAALVFPLAEKFHLYPARGKAAVGLSPPALSAVDGAVSSSLCVCGCVLFFHVLCATAGAVVPLTALGSAALSACLEISSGCSAFAALGGANALFGVCACLSLLGFSVFSQLMALFPQPRALLLLAGSRVLHLLFFWMELRLCLRFLPDALCLRVLSTLAPRVIPMSRLAPDSALCVFAFLCLLLYKCCQSFYNKVK